MAATTTLTDRWVGIYLRISRDRSGRAENVETQEKHAVDYVERQWPGVAYQIYCDNDLTAADPGTYRPEYERLLNDIRAGLVAQVVGPDQDRLTRQPDEWEALMRVLLAAGITETHGYRDGVTSVEPGKRAPGRFKAAMAAEYVEGLKVKLHEKFDKLAADGRPHGGRTFCYERVEVDGVKTLKPIPDRVAAARWAAAEALAGRPYTHICAELEARGFGHWGHSSLMALLRSPTNGGWRSYKGNPEYRRGDWEPVFDEVTYRRLQAMLGEPRPVSQADGKVRVRGGRRRAPVRKYLLSAGCAVCGREGCEVPLVGRHIRGRKPIYICTKERGGCGRLGATAGESVLGGHPGVETTTVELLLARLQSPEFLAELAEGDTTQRREELVAEVSALGARRRKLAARWALEELTDDEWDAAREVLDVEQARLDGDLAALGPTDVGVDPASVVSAWSEMTLQERRQEVDRYIVRVEVLPATPGTQVFDPARVHVVWR